MNLDRSLYSLTQYLKSCHLEETAMVPKGLKAKTATWDLEKKNSKPFCPVSTKSLL